MPQKQNRQVILLGDIENYGLFDYIPAGVSSSQDIITPKSWNDDERYTMKKCIDVRIKKKYTIYDLNASDLRNQRDCSTDLNYKNVCEHLKYAIWKSKINTIYNCAIKYTRNMNKFVRELVDKYDNERVIRMFTLIILNTPGIFNQFNILTNPARTKTELYIACRFECFIVNVVRSSSFLQSFNKMLATEIAAIDFRVVNILIHIGIYNMWYFFAQRIFTDYYIPPSEIIDEAFLNCKYFVNSLKLLRIMYNIENECIREKIREVLFAVAFYSLGRESYNFNNDIVIYLNDRLLHYFSSPDFEVITSTMSIVKI